MRQGKIKIAAVFSENYFEVRPVQMEEVGVETPKKRAPNLNNVEEEPPFKRVKEALLVLQDFGISASDIFMAEEGGICVNSSVGPSTDAQADAMKELSSLEDNQDDCHTLFRKDDSFLRHDVLDMRDESADPSYGGDPDYGEEGPRKKSKTTDIITPDQERELVGWFSAHPIFYDQKDRDFKNRIKRHRLLEAKARQMGTGLTGMLIWTWFKSMRTIYGKLKKRTFCQVSRPLTFRQKWMADSFNFLETHMSVRGGEMRHMDNSSETTEIDDEKAHHKNDNEVERDGIQEQPEVRGETPPCNMQKKWHVPQDSPPPNSQKSWHVPQDSSSINTQKPRHVTQETTSTSRSGTRAAEVEADGDEEGPRKHARITDILTPDQEQDLVGWFAANSCFYDQTDWDFKNRRKRDRLLDQKAKELGLTSMLVWTWFKSMRTVYGKLKKQKLGPVAKPLTFRQQWMADSFSFLDSHMLARGEYRTMSKLANAAANGEEKVHKEDSEFERDDTQDDDPIEIKFAEPDVEIEENLPLNQLEVIMSDCDDKEAAPTQDDTSISNSAKKTLDPEGEDDEEWPRKRSKTTDMLTPDQERELVDWFSNHPIFYDQTEQDFKNKDKRDNLLEVKAMEMGSGLTGTLLWTWFKSMRTIYGKLKKRMYGPSPKPLTFRQQWMMTSFQFLDSHMQFRGENKYLGKIHETPEATETTETAETDEEKTHEEYNESDVLWHFGIPAAELFMAAEGTCLSSNTGPTADVLIKDIKQEIISWEDQMLLKDTGSSKTSVEPQEDNKTVAIKEEAYTRDTSQEDQQEMKDGMSPSNTHNTRSISQDTSSSNSIIRSMLETEAQEEEDPRKQFRVTDNFTREQEQDLVEWFSVNTIFYDQSEKNFKNRELRDKLLEEKGREMGFTGILIWNWFKSLRSQYGKLKKQQRRSGHATKSMTFRQQWMADHFHFLDSHMSVRNESRRHEKIYEAAETDEEDSESEVSVPSYSHQKPTQPSFSHQEDLYSVPAAVSAPVPHPAPVPAPAPAPMPASRGPNSDRMAFCNWWSVETHKFNEQLWGNFMSDMFALVMRYRQMQYQQQPHLPP